MSVNRKLELNQAALKLQVELDAIKITDAVIAEADKILRPLIDLVLKGDLDQLHSELPRRQTFFFCMHDHCLAGWHLVDAPGLLNAVGEFGDALKVFSSEG
ncbi:hypothetical protein J7E62_12530 [Variovorax paradoxus]|nr:hypothetical protein [Variovorax paradoxus]